MICKVEVSLDSNHMGTPSLSAISLPAKKLDLILDVDDLTISLRSGESMSSTLIVKARPS